MNWALVASEIGRGSEAESVKLRGLCCRRIVRLPVSDLRLRAWTTPAASLASRASPHRIDGIVIRVIHAVNNHLLKPCITVILLYIQLARLSYVLMKQTSAQQQ